MQSSRTCFTVNAAKCTDSQVPSFVGANMSVNVTCKAMLNPMNESSKGMPGDYIQERIQVLDALRIYTKVM